MRTLAPPLVSMPVLVELARGRIVELSGDVDGAQASAVVSLVLALQARGEHVAWVAPRGAGLYPPDWARAGIDLDALLVIHVPDHDPSAGPRAAELLLRTGVMGAVVLDLSNARARVMQSGPTRGRRDVLRGEAWLGRLFGLAREHGSRLVLLSPHDHAAPSLGPLVSVRLAVRHASDATGLVRDDEGRLSITTEVLKDKTGTLTAPSDATSDAAPSDEAPSTEPALASRQDLVVASSEASSSTWKKTG